jgi:DNA polymerase
MHGIAGGGHKLRPGVTNAGFVKGPIHALAACVRPTFTGCWRNRFDLLWGDWSSIEARALPWLSLHPAADDLLARYRRNEDVYRYQAGRHLNKKPDEIEDWERQAYGKVPILSLGYGGGEGAFAAMARAYGVNMEESERREIVGEWREANPWATKFWLNTEDAAMWAMKHPGSSYSAGRLSYRFDPDALAGLGALFCELPSGRELCYPDPSIDVVRKPWGTEALGITARKGAWRPKAGEEDNWPRVTLWYGLLVENGTQATCADILTTALLRAKRREWGLLVAGHTHDELLVETDDPEADAPILQALMQTRPGWPGDDALPLHAEVKFGFRYKVSA